MVLAAGVIGFFIGSKAGRGPYERVEGTLWMIRRKAEVQDAIEDVQDEDTPYSVD
jgi:hypothetical protein